MIAVIQFPGSNCDQDMVWAIESLGASASLIWHTETELGDAQAVVLPGGFSYGDYLRGGAIAARSPIMAGVARFAARGGPVLGVCNGFQILTEAGLLPGVLAPNDPPGFICKTVTVTVESPGSPVTAGLEAGQRLRLPVAHAEGRYHLGDDELRKLEERGGVLFRYGDGDNPNGSAADIAGIVNERGNVAGMMPHPERAVEALLGGTDGRALLEGFLAGALAGRESRRAVGA